MKSRLTRWLRRITLPSVALPLLLSPALAGEDDSLTVEARDCLARATAFMRSIATEGGYLWRYAADLSVRAGEEVATPTQVWVQAPGTPAMGGAFLRAYEVTHDDAFLDAARDAAWALVRGQLQSGGWDYVIEFDPANRGQWDYRTDAGTTESGASRGRRNRSTYDDDNTQSALRFLMAFLDSAAHQPDVRDGAIREALDYGLARILDAQYPIGAWPQRWDGVPHDAARYSIKRASLPQEYPREQPEGSYYSYYTFNDDTHRDLVMTLIEAWHRTGRDEYLAAARRGADFLLLAQLPEPQAAWAQQYNAAMEPAWARAFEPPSITAGESAAVVRLLVDLYLEFDDERYLQVVPPAIAWFERSRLAPGRWARLYELHTNRPIYGDRDGRIHYTLEEITEERRSGYRWEGDFGIPAAIRYFNDVTRAGREKWLVEHRQEQPMSNERLSSEARRLIADLDDSGRWLVERRARRIDPEAREWIETGVFIRNVNVLCDYLELQSD